METQRKVSAVVWMVVLSVPALRVAAADCNENGVDDHADVLGGASLDCNLNGVPDECDITPVNYGLGRRAEVTVAAWPAALAVADLDEDGDSDLAVGLHNGGIASLFNDDGGNFTRRTIRTTGPIRLWIVEVADVDGDRKPDLLTNAPGGIDSLLNLGNGNFGAPRRAALPEDPGALAVADLDGDGDVDVAAVHRFTLSILLNDGSGGFASSDGIAVGSNPIDVVAADLDGDGDRDLVTANRVSDDLPGNVSVFLNRGGAVFDGPRNFAAALGPSDIIQVDLDGDGDRDLAVAGRLESSIAVLLNDGDGGFFPPRLVPVAFEPFLVEAGDFDGDGDADLVSAHHELAALGVSLNHGDGTFAETWFRELAGSPLSIVSADLSGDGALEIAVGAQIAATVEVFGGERVAYRSDCNADGIPDDCQLEDNDCNGDGVPDDCQLESNDCDGDGVPDECEPDCNRNDVPDACDLAAGVSADCNLNRVPDECDVTAAPEFFVPPRTEGVFGNFGAPVTLDLDRDGDLDVALASATSGSIQLALNGGDGMVEPAGEVEAGVAGRSLAAADLNGDGRDDLVKTDFRDDVVAVLLATGDATFAPAVHHEVEANSVSVVIGDIDGDGDADVVTASHNDKLSALLNHGDGSFAALRTTSVDGGASLMAAADFDADGLSDVALGDWGGREIVVLRSRGDGVFVEAGRLTPGLATHDLLAADLDRDGDVDVAVAGEGDDQVQILWNDGGGTFSTPGLSLRLDDARVAFRVAAVDIDGDRDLDLLATPAGAFGQDNGIAVLLNRGGGDVFTAARLQVETELEWPRRVPLDVVASDLDGDGLDDLVVLNYLDCPVCDLAYEHVVSRILNRTVPAPSADHNHNGRPDECEDGAFHRGDPDGDGRTLLNDAVFILSFLFRAGVAPDCMEAADADNDGLVQLTDAVILLRFLFQGGVAPAAPGPPGSVCGVDPDAPGGDGDLGCDAYDAC